MDQEEVFKALADSNRRKLIDLLFERDGQTLSELMAHLPMTRFGCMKHLNVLEEANLITSQKIGREKRHFLNPIPIQLVYDRWVSKYSQRTTTVLSGLKTFLEAPMSSAITHVYQIFIKTAPDKLWRALTDGEITPKYYLGCKAVSSWKVGEKCQYMGGDGQPILEGSVLEFEPPKKLVMTFKPLWVPAQPSLNEESATPAIADISPSKVTYEISEEGEVCKLVLTHEGLEPGSLTEDIKSGWARILSGLKSLLETGEGLNQG